MERNAIAAPNFDGLIEAEGQSFQIIFLEDTDGEFYPIDVSYRRCDQ
ncbi:MAG: hypothetical protein ABSB88_10725 [Bryobacteraceae bacterium]